MDHQERSLEHTLTLIRTIRKAAQNGPLPELCIDEITAGEDHICYRIEVKDCDLFFSCDGDCEQRLDAAVSHGLGAYSHMGTADGDVVGFSVEDVEAVYKAIEDAINAQ